MTMAAGAESERTYTLKQVSALGRFYRFTQADMKLKNYQPDDNGEVTISTNPTGFALTKELQFEQSALQKIIGRAISDAYTDCVDLDVKDEAEALALKLRKELPEEPPTIHTYGA